MAKVFLGVPTFNRPRLVRQAVRSVLSQQGADLELLVSDDASDARSAKVVAAFVDGLKDHRASLCHHEEHLFEYGQGRFLFSKRGSADYFVILHDDDVLQEGYLEVALKQLDADASLACYVANPYIFDSQGERSKAMTEAYLRRHGRHRYPEGRLGILEPLLAFGFFPISGTVFRASALAATGFVDPDLSGNYPFELDVLIRLGAHGKQGWFDPETRIGFCYHQDSLRNRLWYNQSIMSNVVKLVSEYRFKGRCERLRRKFLGFSQQRLGAILLGQGEWRRALGHARLALSANCFSIKNWLLGMGLVSMPWLVRRSMRRKIR